MKTVKGITVAASYFTHFSPNFYCADFISVFSDIDGAYAAHLAAYFVKSSIPMVRKNTCCLTSHDYLVGDVHALWPANSHSEGIFTCPLLNDVEFRGDLVVSHLVALLVYDAPY